MIRQAELKDMNDIMSILKANADVFPKNEISAAEKSIKRFMKKRNNEGRFFVATTSGKIIGCCGFLRQDDTYGVYHLCWLAVHPDSKRIGVATELYSFVESCVLKLGARLIIAYTGSGEVNLYFYRKMGFKEAGKIPKYYNESKDLIWYYKHLKCMRYVM